MRNAKLVNATTVSNSKEANVLLQKKIDIICIDAWTYGVWLSYALLALHQGKSVNASIEKGFREVA